VGRNMKKVERRRQLAAASSKVDEHHVQVMPRVRQTLR